MFKNAILAGAVLVLSTGAALSADMMQIKTEAEFRKLIVGKKMTNEWDGYSLYQADNQTSGIYKGMKISGVWSWVGDTVCQPFFLDGKHVGSDCRTVAIKGKTVTVTRNGGKGKPYNLTITDE